MLIESSRDRVRTLRALGATPDALALRRTLERAVGAASLRPRGLSPRAIVCVRRLRVGASGLNGAGWPARLEQHMQGVVAHAARPLLGPVPSGAEAVVFQDEVELLACLIRDSHSGNGGAWWWRGLFGAAAHESLVQRTLHEAPMLVPATIALLAELGLAEGSLHAFDHASCDRLSAAVRSVFGLERAEVSRTADDAASVEAEQRSTDHPPARAIAALGVALGGVTSASVLASLAPPQRDLFVLALVLARAPWIAREAELRPLADRWIAERQSPDPALMRAVRMESSAKPLEPAEQTHARDALAAIAPTDAVTEMAEQKWPAAKRLSASEGATAGVAVAATFASSPAASPLGDPAANAPMDTFLARTSGVSHDSALTVPSEFAGAFYLVNVALHLELYADFTKPSRPGLSLPLGDFLALVGAHVCGPAIRRDPLWPLLAELGGRDARAEPGENYVASVNEIVAIAERMEIRTAHAFGVPPGAALALLCRRRGHIAMSDTRLDVRFPLATHPLEIRVAGLDRNPGWVPAAGRVIEFHYD